MLSTPRIPFLLHALVETVGACSFILNPESQLSPLTPASTLILQSKGGLLLFSSLICVIFLSRPVDETTRSVAVAFAFWHIWPCYRAVVRLHSGMDSDKPQGKALGGPVVHLGVHLGLLLLFIAAAFSGR